MRSEHDDETMTTLAAPRSWQTRAQRLRQRPRALMLLGVALMGLLALLYLNQVVGVAQASNQLSALNAQHEQLERQHATLEQKLGAVTSPSYIDQHARAAGLAPASASGATPIIVTPGSAGNTSSANGGH